MKKFIEPINKMLTLEKFENDLINFIKSHSYTKEQQAEPEVIRVPEDDFTKITLHTPNGDYEEIAILIKYIA